MNVAVLLSRQ